MRTNARERWQKMLQIKYRKISELKPYPNNARKHPPKQLQKLAANIKAIDFIVPVIIDAQDMILAGHGRLEAAKMAGLKEIPTVSVNHLTEAQKRAFILADNRLAQDSTWDMAKAKEEFEFLEGFEIELGQTAFDTAEIDLALGGEASAESPEDDIEDLPPEYQPVTQTGDIWHLGVHRLICGDALQASTYKALMPDEAAEVVFTDPPYNVEIDGHVKRKAASGTREFAMASGEMSSGQFMDFLRKFLTETCKFLEDGAIVYVCMDWRHMQELLGAAEGLLAFKQLCVWSKDKAGMGTFYRSQHELVFVFKYGTKPHINNFGLGNKGRYRTNIWNYPVVHVAQQPELEGVQHPTVKPASMVIDALRDCSHRGHFVLDPFGGSGTTLIAAEKTGREARLIELDPIYCDMIVRRWEKYTGKEAFLEGEEATFEEVKQQRKQKENKNGR
jgi:DNA modification methylase